MKKSRFSDIQIIAVLKQAETGSPVPELCREHGIMFHHVLQVAQQIWRNSRFSGFHLSVSTRTPSV